MPQRGEAGGSVLLSVISSWTHIESIAPQIGGLFRLDPTAIALESVRVMDRVGPVSDQPLSYLPLGCGDKVITP